MTDQQFPNNNQESAKELGGGTSTTPVGEQKPEQKPDDGTSTTPAGKPETRKELDAGKPTTSAAYQEQRSKTDDKGFGEGKYSSEGKLPNPFPFVSQKTRQEDENKHSGQSSTKEKSKYSNLQTQLLKDWRERYKKEIENFKETYDHLTEKIEGVSAE